MRKKQEILDKIKELNKYVKTWNNAHGMDGAVSQAQDRIKMLRWFLGEELE